MTDLTPETLAALLDQVYAEHDAGVHNNGWMGCRTCDVALQIEHDEEGQPLYNPFIRHRHEKAAEAIAALVADALAAEKARADKAEKECDFHKASLGDAMREARKAHDRAAALESRVREHHIDHPFLPVAGHPDDDECTYRADGTDATYCGLTAAQHTACPICEGVAACWKVDMRAARAAEARVAVLEADLADMTRQRDEALEKQVELAKVSNERAVGRSTAERELAETTRQRDEAREVAAGQMNGWIKAERELADLRARIEALRANYIQQARRRGDLGWNDGRVRDLRAHADDLQRVLALSPTDPTDEQPEAPQEPPC